jgi:hypothetical protein
MCELDLLSQSLGFVVAVLGAMDYWRDRRDDD